MSEPFVTLSEFLITQSEYQVVLEIEEKYEECKDNQQSVEEVLYAFSCYFTESAIVEEKDPVKFYNSLMAVFYEMLEQNRKKLY